MALESRAVILCVPDVAAARRIRAVQAFDTSNMWQTVAIVILNVRPGCMDAYSGSCCHLNGLFEYSLLHCDVVTPHVMSLYIST